MFEYLKTMIRGTLNLRKLVQDGLTVGKNFHAQEGVIIDPGHCWLITIGNNVTLAPRVHILAHDASTKIPLGYTKIGKVTIGDNVFVGANTIILPNVTIGDHVVIGAGSVVTKDLEARGVYCGNPCVKIYEYDKWIEKQRNLLGNSPKYNEEYMIQNITDEKKKKMQSDLNSRIGYII